MPGQSDQPQPRPLPAATASRGLRYAGAVPDRRAREVSDLTRAFAEEPELILAYLESVSGAAPAAAPTILAAALGAIERQPDFADLYHFAAQAAESAQQPQLAVELLDTALRLNPRYNDARILAGRLALRAGRANVASQHLETALTHGADYPDVHTQLGHAYRAQGHLTRAITCYRRALALHAGLTEARQALAALEGGAGAEALP